MGAILALLGAYFWPYFRRSFFANLVSGDTDCGKSTVEAKPTMDNTPAMAGHHAMAGRPAVRLASESEIEEYKRLLEISAHESW